jgi:O-antigen/teichoic acid export membrane protein
MQSLPEHSIRVAGIKKSILAGFIGKGIGFVVNLLIVPICLKYLGETDYGIWVTLSSMIVWLNFFDLGFGMGLQNYLTTALANNDLQRAKKLVSTVFFTFCATALILFLIGWCVIELVNWPEVFASPLSSSSQLRLALLLLLVFFVIQFPFSITQSIYSAFQQRYKQLLWNAAASLLSVAALLWFTHRPGGLVNCILATSGAFVLVSLFNALYLYFFDKKNLLPSWKDFSLREIRHLSGISLSFMGLQFAAIVSYQTDNYIILKTLGPAAVAHYSVVQRLFITFIALHGLIASPFWPAITDAYARNDIPWIRNSLAQLRKITFLFFLPLIVILLLLGPQLLKMWLGSADYFSHTLFSLFSVITFSLAMQSVYSYVMNGCNQPGLLLKVTLFTIPLYLVLALAGIRWWGLNGFLIAKIVINTFIILGVQILFVHRKILA